MYALALTFDSFNLQCCSVARMFSSSAGWLVLVVLAEFLETSALETKFTTVCASPGTVCASWAVSQYSPNSWFCLPCFPWDSPEEAALQPTIRFIVRYFCYPVNDTWNVGHDFTEGKKWVKSLGETVRVPWCWRCAEVIYPYMPIMDLQLSCTQSVRRLGFITGNPNPVLSMPSTLHGLRGSLWCTRNVGLLPSVVKCRDDSSVPQNTV